MMTLQNSRRRCVWAILSLVALLAISSSQVPADEYPVLAEWTQGNRNETFPTSEVIKQLNQLVLLAANEAADQDGYRISIYPRILNQEEEAKLGKDQPRGVLVSRVTPNSPAAKAELEAGDLIVAVDQEQINYLDQLSQLVQASEGKTITLNVLRDGKSLQVEVTPAKSIPQTGMLFFSGKEGEIREDSGRQKLTIGRLKRFSLKDWNDHQLVGLITAVSRGNLVEISLGSEDGIKVGETFRVYRPGQAYLGRVQVIETGADRSAAKILRDDRTGEIQKGDRVAIRPKDDDDDDDDDDARGYWLGIFPQDVDRGMAEKLKVEPSSILVRRVMPASPAAQAKLKSGDIILAAGDKKLTGAEHLGDIVQASAGKTIHLKVRSGEKVFDVEVTPARRGQGRKMMVFGEHGEKRSREEAEEAREKPEGMLFRIHKHQREAQQEREPQWGSPRLKPGMKLVERPQFPPSVAATVAAASSGLPDDMQVTIQKRGNKPARVTVTQGVKKWQTTENELGMLPPPALRYASHLLGRPMMPAAQGGLGGFAIPGVGVAGQPRRFEIRTRENGEHYQVDVTGVPEKTPAGSPEGVRIQILKPGEATAPPRDKELQELKAQLQKLRHDLEAMKKQKSHPHKKAKNKSE